MVTPGGFEPSIFDLGGRCIILLCYGAISYNKILYTKKALLAITKQYITARADAQLKNNYKRSASPGGILHSTRTPVCPHRRVRQTLKFSKLAKGSSVLVTKSRMVSP